VEAIVTVEGQQSRLHSGATYRSQDSRATPFYL